MAQPRVSCLQQVNDRSYQHGHHAPGKSGTAAFHLWRPFRAGPVNGRSGAGRAVPNAKLSDRERSQRGIQTETLPGAWNLSGELGARMLSASHSTSSSRSDSNCSMRRAIAQWRSTSRGQVRSCASWASDSSRRWRSRKPCRVGRCRHEARATEVEIALTPVFYSWLY